MKAYGANFRTNDPVEVEIECIKLGGRWRFKGSDRICGEGLFHHHKRLQTLLYPWKKWDRWSELVLRRLCEKKFVLLSGPNDSTKTHSVAAFALSQYIVWPNEMAVLVSSTDARSLDLRIFGEIKMLWNEARRVYDVPGRVIESRQMIVTRPEDEDDAADFRNGIIGIPCVVGGTFYGLGKYVGIKNERTFLAGDELQFMGQAYFDGVANLCKRPGFKGAGMFNPKDRMDVAGKLAEPAPEVGGWEGYEPTGKTMEWPTRFPDGWCIQLDGRDSPNNDAAPGDPVPFPYLITRESITKAVAFYGEDSYQVSMTCYGAFPKDAMARRVITRSLCERFRAMEEPIWSGGDLTLLFALDAAYGAVGGDRCVGVELAFGKCADGVTRLAFNGQPVVIPVKAGLVRDGVVILPEDQIVEWVMAYCMDGRRNIPPHHVGFDSTGRGSLVQAFARLWSPAVEGFEFGGIASERAVSARIVTPCREYYANMVTQLWFDTATLIESDQCRGMPVNVMEEGCMRGWDIVRGKRIQVEPKTPTSSGTKEGGGGLKRRMQRSPDLYDSFATGVALAQKLGFQLGQAGMIGAGKMPSWLEELKGRQVRLTASRQLVYR